MARVIEERQLGFEHDLRLEPELHRTQGYYERGGAYHHKGDQQAPGV